MPLTTRQAATAGFSVKKFLALLKDRTVIQDERFLLWELRSGGGKISYDAADTGDRINTYYAARGIKLDEEDEKEVKALVRRAPCSLGRGFRNAFAHCPRLTQANELLQPGNALYFDELKSDAVRARGRQRSAQRSAARVNRRPARERTETFSAYRQRI
jgi:hypothetical protein